MTTTTDKHQERAPLGGTTTKASLVVTTQQELGGLPPSVADPALVTYRSVGIGLFGVVMRFAGMPLEKIALFMNSSQVVGKGQFRQAIQLTFREGAMAPYRVVGGASLTAWFLQYSVMGFAFQLVDHSLSHLLGVPVTPYGDDLLKNNNDNNDNNTTTTTSATSQQIKVATKTLLAPVLASSLESTVSNRAEVQRYFGREHFAAIQSNLLARRNPILLRVGGPAMFPSIMRNTVMCQTTFILTPYTYKLYFPQEYKTKSSLFWFGLGMNVFVGNSVAITQQALWGRSLDMLAQQGRIEYATVIKSGLQKEGMAAFFTVPKWGSRVLMNAPAQGVLPWFYNDVLPLGEHAVLSVVKSLYEQGNDTTSTTLPETVPTAASSSSVQQPQPMASSPR